MTRREQSHVDGVTDAQRVSKGELRRARERSIVQGDRPWASRRKRTGVAQFVATHDKSEWLARERAKAAQIALTPEEIAEDERYRR